MRTVSALLVFCASLLYADVNFLKVNSLEEAMAADTGKPTLVYIYASW